MRTLVRIAAIAAGGLLVGLNTGCPGGDTINPFLTLVEQQFIPFTEDEVDPDETLLGGALDGVAGGGGITTVDTRFREAMTITFNNNSARGDLEFNLLAWVDATSIQDDEDRDALYNSNYVELTEEIRLGTAFILAPGTFVYNGGGTNGNLRFRIPRGTDSDTEGASNQQGEETDFSGEDATQNVGEDGGTIESVGGVADEPVQRQLTLASPDRILIYLDAPDSCDSTAFVFLDQGDPVRSFQGGVGFWGGSNRDGPFKPLQAAEYVSCDPLTPALILKTGAGARQGNEFFEGEDVTLDFFLLPQIRTGTLEDINRAKFLFASFGGVDSNQFVSLVDLADEADDDGDDDQGGDDGGDDDGEDGDGGNVLTP